MLTATAMNILRESIMGRSYLIMHLKRMLIDGCLNTLIPKTYLEQWKTLAQ